MIKRIAIAIIVFLVVFLLASALVGADVISATFGLVLWLIGLAAAIGAFVKTKQLTIDAREGELPLPLYRRIGAEIPGSLSIEAGRAGLERAENFLQITRYFSEEAHSIWMKTNCLKGELRP